MAFTPDLTPDQLPIEEDRSRRGTVAGWPLKRILAWTVGIVALLVVLVLGALAFVVSFAVELPFVRNQVDATIEKALGPGYAATVGSTVLAIDPVLGLVISLSDISIVDALDQEVARVPSAMIAVSLSAIFTSQNTVRSIEVDGAWFSIRRDGGVAFFGNGATPVSEALPATEAIPAPLPPLPAPGETTPSLTVATADGGFANLSEPIEALDRSLEEAMALAAQGFDRIGLYNATVELWRAGDTEPHRFERTDLRIAADAERGRLSATMTASGYSGRWSVSADRILNPITGARTLTLRFSQLTLADFFPAVGRDPSVITSNIPFYGRAIVGIDADGRVTGADARLDLGAGYFAFGPNAQPIRLSDATIRLGWDVANEIIYVEPSPFVAGNGGATIVGTITPDGVGRYAFDLESTDAVLAPRDSPAPPLAVDRMRLAGALDLNAGLLYFDRAAIITGSGSLVAAGSIGFERGGPSIALVATLDEMPIAAFKQLWPPGLEDGGRGWLLQSVTEGTIAGTLAAEIPAGILGSGGELTPEMVNLELTLNGVAFNTFKGFPAVTEAHGRAVLAGTHFAVDLDGGTIVAPAGGELQLTAATFLIGQTAAAVPTGHVEVYATGPAAAFGAIADAEPIYALRQFGVPAEALHGTGAALMSANWPLVDGMTIEEVEWRIGLTLAGLTSDAPLDGMTIANGNLELHITPTVVDVTGTAEIDGVPANVDFTFPMVAEVDGRQQLRMVLDEEARARLGFNLEGFLGGTVHAVVTDLGANGPGQRYDLDLEQARVILAPLGWAKPVGVPATMSFDLISVEGGSEIRNLVFGGDGFGFAATVWLDENMAIIRAEVTDFALRRADSMSFTYEQDGAGWAIDVVGEAFDVRGVIAQGIGEINGTEGVTDIRINGRFDELIGFNGERIRDAEVVFVSAGGVIERVDISGTLQGAPLQARFELGPSGPVLNGYVGNGGALLRFANIYARAHGGELTIVGGGYADGSLYGQVALIGFDIVDEPGVSAFMAPAETPPGEIPNVVNFERLTFDFIQRGSVITIHDALLRGGDMGAVGAGWIDMGAGTISISGTYIPAYTFNNIFGRIPLVGLALGAGPNEGLIGLTFQVAGPMDNAQLQINPLSVIAPGIFRKIFQFQ